MDILSDGYGILPRKVLRDKEISSAAKLLFVEISSLCAEKGYCWATNSYLGKSLGVSTRTVTRLLTELEKYVSISENDGRRTISLVYPIAKSVAGDSQECLAPIDKNVQQNSIIDNNINNNILSLPDSLGKNSLTRLINVYSLFWKELYGFRPKINFGMIGKLFKPVLGEFNEYQIAAFIILHFSWRGASGNNDYTFKTLSDKCFPLEWIPRAVNEYSAYLINTMGIDINNKDCVIDYVNTTLKDRGVNIA